jgi:hypothetical protein
MNNQGTACRPAVIYPALAKEIIGRQTAAQKNHLIRKTWRVKYFLKLFKKK